jgi:hypothetical protein
MPYAVTPYPSLLAISPLTQVKKKLLRGRMLLSFGSCVAGKEAERGSFPHQPDGRIAEECVATTASLLALPLLLLSKRGFTPSTLVKEGT